MQDHFEDKAEQRFTDAGEEVLYVTNPHFLYLFRAVASAFVMAVLFFTSIFILPWLPILIKFLLGCLLIVAVCYFVFKYLQWRRIECVVTPRRLITASGVFTIRSSEVPLERIGEITLNSPLFERLIGVGNLRVASLGEDSDINLHFIPQPAKLKAAINRAREARNTKGTGAAAPAALFSALDEIAKLGDLFDKGLITRNEFERYKAILFARFERDHGAPMSGDS
ncbi:PH domain-containing protein [Acidithrix sp. C25]|uniref:PH domain-containing protein n=1 Tax=Acidithrix sp. C25 TaxID=1671482 RepID=UPI00191BC888|nr:PH domain-containing protein [Acidithrix sp. C25]